MLMSSHNNNCKNQNQNMIHQPFSQGQQSCKIKDLLSVSRQSNTQGKFKKSISSIRCIKYSLMVIFLILILWTCIWFLKIDHQNTIRNLLQSESSQKITPSKIIVKKKLKQILFPKILWIQSDYPLDGQKMITSVFVNNWLNFAKKSKMQIRVVNDFNAFGYLSPEMIDRVIQIKQKSKDYIQISQILRLALLIQHGGLSFKMDSVMLREEFEQIHEITKRVMIQFIQRKRYIPDILLFYNVQNDKIMMSDDVIYCNKQSKILIQILNNLGRILANGQWPYMYLNGQKNEDKEEKIQQYHDAIKQLMNAMIKDNFTNIDQFSQKFQILSLNDANNPIALRLSDSEFYDDSRIDRQQFVFKHCNIPIHLGNMNSFKLMLIEQNLNNNMNSWSSSSSIYSSQILKIQSNRWIVEPVEQFVEVELCIISLKVQNKESFQFQIKQSLNKLSQQTFKQWKAIYFVQKLNKTQINYKKDNNDVIIVNASVYEGLNFQRAAIKYCGSNSIALLINYNQYFEKQNSLQTLSSYFLNRNTFGAFIATITNTNIYRKTIFNASNMKNTQTFKLQEYYSQIKNSFRAVRIENYRYLSHFTLHNYEGRYYDIQIPLMALLQLSANFESCKKTEAYYHIKRISKKINLPFNVKQVYSVQLIAPNRMQTNLQDKIQYSAINFHNELCKGITQFTNLRRHPLENMFLLNDGTEFQYISNKSTTQNSIPKIIHTILLTQNETSYKRLLIKNNKQMHPSYNYVVWSQDNINIQNFPSAYNSIKKLMQFKTPLTRQNGINQTKISYFIYIYAESIKNLMKKEILYRFGGFYVDQNYMFFKKNILNEFLSSKAMIISNRQPNIRFQRFSAVIGCIKGFQNLLRVASRQNLTTLNPFSSQMNSAQDNFLYGQLIQERQQYDKDIAQPPLYMFYPFTEETDNKCVADSSTKASLLFQNRKRYLKHCHQIYNDSWGIYFFGEY